MYVLSYKGRDIDNKTNQECYQVSTAETPDKQHLRFHSVLWQVFIFIFCHPRKSWGWWLSSCNYRTTGWHTGVFHLGCSAVVKKCNEYVEQTQQPSGSLGDCRPQGGSVADVRCLFVCSHVQHIFWATLKFHANAHTLKSCHHRHKKQDFPYVYAHIFPREAGVKVCDKDRVKKSETMADKGALGMRMGWLLLLVARNSFIQPSSHQSTSALKCKWHRGRKIWLCVHMRKRLTAHTAYLRWMWMCPHSHRWSKLFQTSKLHCDLVF